MFRATYTPVSGPVAETGLGTNLCSLGEAEDGVTELSPLQSPATGRSPCACACMCVRARACALAGVGVAGWEPESRALALPVQTCPVGPNLWVGVSCGSGEGL